MTDWRNADHYAHIDGLDRSGLAWECLRRNRAYRAAYPDMAAGRASAAPWGLRFPG